MIKEKILRLCEIEGLDVVGFIPSRRFEELIPFYQYRKDKNLENPFEEACIEKRIDPNTYLEGAQTIIAIAFPYNDQVKTKVSSNGFSIYTQRQDYHRVVKYYLEKISDQIRSLGGRAVSLVDSHGLPERYIAYLAGLGFIGKNNMLITPKYGSYVFLGEILTDLEIPCEEEGSLERLMRYETCGACTRCQRTCPASVLDEKANNPNGCLSYLTQKKDLNKEEIKALKGNVFGCDYCQLACPYNQDSAQTPLKAFKTLDIMTKDLEVYAKMNNSFFKEHLSHTSCGWRGKNVIKRNALIAMHQKGRTIDTYKGESAYINDYIDQLNQQK